jgi:phosphatidylglycerol lysyltransferase
VLALRYVGNLLPYRKTAFASFLSYAFSNTLGFGMLTGGSVRYRLYGSWGIQTLDIARIVLFCTVTFTLGLFAFGALVFLLCPLNIPEWLHMPFASTRPLGALFLTIVAAYFGASLLLRSPLRVWALELPVPRPLLATAQVALATLDWTLAGSTLYMLLPHRSPVPLPHFLAVFILAQVAGIVSQMPGGLGVFETVMVLLLSPLLRAPDMVAALMAFRFIYYLAPLALATGVLGANELARKRKKLVAAAMFVGHWTSGMAPSVMGALTFVSGASLLFSGATPDMAWRMHHAQGPLPLQLVELSHFAGSVVGVWLLILSRGIWLRLDAAYLLTGVLLALGAIFSFLKGFVYHESLALLAVLAALTACRHNFTRKSSLLSGTLTSGWLASVGAVLLATVWLTLFAYKHVEYRSDLWWRFAFEAQAPRSLRALVGAACGILAWSLGRLVRPARAEPARPTQEDLATVEAIVRDSPETSHNLALLGDKSFLFSESRKAFIMYSIERGSWIAMGDPAGPEEEWPELLWRFREMCHEHAGQPVFYEVGSAHLSLYLDLGMNLLKLGEDARVSLPDFSTGGSASSALRAAKNRIERSGYVFEMIPVGGVPEVLDELRAVSDIWMENKHTREKRFSLGSFDAAYVLRFPAAVARTPNGRIEAFATVWTTGNKEELSVDLMRHVPSAPNGLMDYLFIQLMLYGKSEGYRWFNLGMAPLSGLPQHELAPLWNRLGGFLFRHGEHFYNFQGLRRYKAKYGPEWRPRYLASPGGITLPQVLRDLSSLISGGVGGMIGK